MPVLCDRTIEGYLEDDVIAVEPIDEGIQIQPCSVDLRLGDEYYGEPKHQNDDGYRDDADVIKFRPFEFIVGTTREHLDLPEWISAMIKGRSSVGRKGVQVHNAGWVDPGWEGQITLELINFSSETVEIPVGQRICQVVFLPLDQSPSQAYGEREDSKYQGQVGATPSRLEAHDPQ